MTNPEAPIGGIDLEAGLKAAGLCLVFIVSLALFEDHTQAPDPYASPPRHTAKPLPIHTDR